MKNEYNYWVNGFWFDMYDEARRYADFMMESQKRYYAIFTRSEIEAYGAEKLKGEGNTSTDQ
jgi:hypothetical protein